MPLVEPLAGIAQDITLLDVKRAITDFEIRIDYAERTDKNAVYVGKAPQGTATTAAVWVVQRLTYDASSRLTRVEVRTDVVWDDRAVGW